MESTSHAIGLIKHRLADTYGPEIAKTYKVIGEPTDVDGARQLAQDEPWQFQAWALGLVGARIATSDRKGGDRGIDGKLYFHEGRGETKQIVISVKGGEHLVPAFVNELRGVVAAESAQIGVLLTFAEPTRGMRQAASAAGFYESPDWGRFPAIQLLTVEELLLAAGIEYPRTAGMNRTYRRAERAELKVATPTYSTLIGLLSSAETHAMRLPV